MSLDAATLALVAGELKTTLLDAKIDKIFEPTRDEVLMTLRTRTETHRLLLSARSGSARVCLTKESFENPLTPPGFCMLLRKHLTGGRLIELRREPGDRIVYFDFRCTNEMGDLVTNTLAVELMGRYSNLVLVQDGRIIDALKRVDFDDSEVRQLLPGLAYTLPPKPARPDFLETSAASIVAAACEKDLPVAQALGKTVAGVGPVVVREAVCRALGETPALACDLTAEEKAKLAAAIDALKDEHAHGGAVHRCLHGIMHLIEDHAEAAGIPLRFAASKLVEGDALVTEALNLSENEREMVEHIVVQMESERGLDRAAAIADMRFDFIHRLCARTVVRPRESREHIRSRKIDRVLTGKYTAIPAFIALMALVFYLTFNVVGAALQGLLARGIDALTALTDGAFAAANVNPVIHSLVIDGIFGGVGSVLSFIPIIVVLFFFLSMLEDSGYMARIAFVMDKLLRRLGLSGRSIVPMLIGFGCTVPGVMASRTLPSARDRRMTIVLTPFMSCTAKLPIYGFFTAAFFPGRGGLVMLALYLLGILVGVLVALASKNTLFKGEAVPFVMELPNYRLPGLKNVAHLLWDKARDFLQRAFTVIFLASIVVWFLQTFDFRLNVVADARDSILAVIAGFLSPVFAPLGFGDWRIVTALAAGFMAKESVVSTLTVLLGGAAVTSILTPLSAAALLVFCLLYTPCVAAVAAIRRELGGRWAALVVVFQCVLAWLCAAAVHAVGSLL